MKWVVLVVAVACFACGGHENTITGASDGALMAAAADKTGSDSVTSNGSHAHGRTRSVAPSNPAAEYEGIVKTASATDLTIVDAHRGDVTFTIGTDTIISKGQTAATTADLHTGDRVHVRAAKVGDALVASLVLIQNNSGHPDAFQFEGIVKAIAADSLTLTSHGGDVVLIVDGNTVFSPAQPVVGDRVHVVAQRSDNGLLATTVTVQSGDDDGGDGSGEQPGTTMTANGLVSDTGSSQITVESQPHGSVTVQIDANTIIRKQGAHIGAADIKKGDYVNAMGTRVDDHTLLAKQIEVRGESGHK